MTETILPHTEARAWFTGISYECLLPPPEAAIFLSGSHPESCSGRSKTSEWFLEIKWTDQPANHCFVPAGSPFSSEASIQSFLVQCDLPKPAQTAEGLIIIAAFT